MQVSTIELKSLRNVDVDTIVISVWAFATGSKVELSLAAKEIDLATNGLVTRLIEQGEVGTSDLTCTKILGPPGLRASVLAVVGLENRQANQNGLAYRAAGAAAKALASKQRKRVVFALDLEPVADVVTGAQVGCVGQDLFRSQRKLFSFEEILVVTDNPAAIKRGGVLGDAVNLTRRLVNFPANEIYPETFAEECVRQGKSAGFETEVWDLERLQAERCGALLAVARGSIRPPRLVIMRYNGGKTDHPPLALVGKGVTFDSGGLSIKPTDGMIDMKCDMAGAATVLGAMTALAKLKVPANVWGFVGLAENMISGDSFKLGDILVARNGKTIEVLNTDAEGRLVLADVLDVAVSLKVQKIVDLATLTGACMVALGRQVVGGMSNNESWYSEIKTAAEECGEPLWQLPMFTEYSEQIRSAVADIKNIGDGRWGGAITAAKFLEEFVGKVPWVHLDIAGPSFNDKGSAWVDGGASGCFVRTLIQLVEKQSIANH